MFFEAHRLSVFTPRALDVDVVLDLMIHDLDIVLTFANSPVREVRAVGLPILSPKVDIANVRVEFESGCVANFTASRVSTERVRKLRFFEPRQYVSIDYARRDLLVIRLDGSVPLEIAAALEGGTIDPAVLAQLAAGAKSGAGAGIVVREASGAAGRTVAAGDRVVSGFGADAENRRVSRLAKVATRWRWRWRFRPRWRRMRCAPGCRTSSNHLRANQIPERPCRG